MITISFLFDRKADVHWEKLLCTLIKTFLITDILKNVFAQLLYLSYPYHLFSSKLEVF